MSRMFDALRERLGDSARVDAFDRATRDVITPGSVALDGRSLAGILAVMAVRAGAARAYACGSTRLVSAAASIAAANGCAGRVHAINGFAEDVDAPERVDVAILEALGRYGVDDGLVPTAAAVRHRWLKPEGTIVPRAIAIHVAPVEHERLLGLVDYWRTPIDGFDASAMHAHAMNAPYPHAFDPDDLIAPGATLGRCDLMSAVADACIAGTVRFAVPAARIVHGLALWWSADFTPRVHATNSPGTAGRIQRRQMYLPIEAPLDVASGDEIVVDLIARGADGSVAWKVRTERGGRMRAACDHDSRRREFDASPSVDWRRARAWRRVIELCDGTHTVSEIERMAYASLPGLFRDETDAAAIVADVVLRLTRERR